MRIRIDRRIIGTAAAMLFATTVATRAEALTTVYFEVAPGTVVVGGVVQVATGGSFEIDVVADMDTPIVGWGLDVAPDGGEVAVGSVAVGPSFTGVFAPDGDGLAGLAPAPGVSGTGITLATLIFDALSPGAVTLYLAITAGDLTEGFALIAPGAFDTVVFGAPLAVNVVPEPGAGLLLGLALAGLGVRRRRRD